MEEFDTERILIVDDQASIRKLLSHKLTEEGYDCVTVEDGDAALDILKEQQFSLILLDISMPGKSGMQVLGEISPHYPDTAVIMITSTDDTDTAIETMKLGAYDYIIKPIKYNGLLMSVRRALESRKLKVENREYQLHLEEKIEEQARKIRESFLNSIKSLALALEAKDKYTGGHSQRVANLATEIAREMNLPPEQVEKISFAALVHDIGKIGISETIINKNRELTDEEYKSIAAHSAIGQNILTPVLDDEEILLMVRHHHERYDGEGYPDGLAGEQIPLGARIIAVADMYDAMMSDRSYRKAVGFDVTIAELKRQTPAQLDPKVVEAFLKVTKKALEKGQTELLAV